MPTAQGHLTNHDHRRIYELRNRGLQASEIAVIIGVHAGTVRKLCTVHAMRDRALRYTAFVERAAAYAPLLVPPSPF